MADSPLLTSVSLALPTKIQGAPHITQFINQLLLPSTIDAAVYLDLQRVIKVFGPTSTWTVAAMDGAATRGRLKLVKLLDTNRSEGCSAAAFNGAAANNHLGVLRWLLKQYARQCNLTEALVSAAATGNLKIVKFLHAQRFTAEQEAADANEEIEVLDVVEHILANYWVHVDRALAVAAKTELTEVVRILLRGSERFRISIASRSSCPLATARYAGPRAGVLALLFERCGTVGEHWSAAFITPALREAAEAGQMDAVPMLLPRCRGFIVGEAFAAAISNEHATMVEFFLRTCPTTEMIPALVAAADHDSPGVLERVLAKCGPYDGLDFQGKKAIRSCFISAASRGVDQIVKTLANRLVSTSEFPAQKAICLVLENAAAHSKYEIVEIILDAFKLGQRRLPVAVADSAFKKAHASNDRQKVELLTKYCGECVAGLSLPKSDLEHVKKKQRRR